MPVFFFDTYDGLAAYRDEFGVDLDAIGEVADQAAALLPDMARDILPMGPSHDFAVLVRDEGGAVVHRAALVFRGEWTRGTESSPPRLADDDLLSRSRATRAVSRLVKVQLQHNIAELMALIQTSMETAAAAKAGAARRGDVLSA